MKWFELHKHTTFSLFDGYGIISDIVDYAKELDMPALGISDHGNTCGSLKLYSECKAKDIVPIIGVEAYFQPTFDKEKHQYHLCLFAKNQLGYSNIMQMISYANMNNFYKKGIVTFDLLKQFHEGVICTSACINGFVPRMVITNKEKVDKAATRFTDIFGEDFYIEVMPIPIDEEGTQEYVNRYLFDYAKGAGIKCIPTTDSHYTRREEFNTYKLIHEMTGSKLDVERTYGARHMHSYKEMQSKLEEEFSRAESCTLFNGLTDIYKKIDIELDFSSSIPVYMGNDDSYSLLKKKCISKLSETGRKNEEYIERLKMEAKVIHSHGLSDYFMIVSDYVEEAKRKDIYVGPGRGSVCGSLVAELLGITAVDPIAIGNDFERFLRADKKKMPDIDLDFEYGRRDEVIQYLLDKYEGNSAQVITYGFYKTKNLVNDLCKLLNVAEDDIKIIKSTLEKSIDDQAHFEFEKLDYHKILSLPLMSTMNKRYHDIITHFCRLYGQVRYFGTHAAGIVITSDNISKYMSLIRYNDKFATCFDKYDLESNGFLKFDILGLKTLNVLHEIEELTGDKYHTSTVSAKAKKAIYDGFREGKTTGIFQLNKKSAQDILISIKTQDIQDLIAAISLNRPGTLQLHMDAQYSKNKEELDTTTSWYPYTSDTYGTIVYQEHVMRICRGLAKMDNDSVDKLMKFKFNDAEKEILRAKFVTGAKEHSNIPENVSSELFESMSKYLFNKGHGSGYALISEWQMYHKLFHPAEFWYASLKYLYDETKEWSFKKDISKEGVVIFLPHVNYTADYSLRTVDNEKVIQEGLITIKGVGLKAAQKIEEERKANGIFRSKQEFIDRCKGREVHVGVIKALDEYGSLEFNKQRYISRVIKYNSSFYR